MVNDKKPRKHQGTFLIDLKVTEMDRFESDNLLYTAYFSFNLSRKGPSDRDARTYPKNFKIHVVFTIPSPNQYNF